MRILVTGGAGFIGSHLVDALAKQSHEVIVVDTLISGNKNNITVDVPVLDIDVRSAELFSVFEDYHPEIVFHLAAQIDVRHSMTDPHHDADINVLGTLNLLQAAQKYKTKKIVFSSTGGAIYGEQLYFPADEKHITNPASVYGISKLSAEKYLQCLAPLHNITPICLRYSNVYGPRQDPHGEAGVVAIFINKMLQNETPSIFGDGKQTRDFVYVEDVIQANLRALNYQKSGTFNISTATETNVNELYHLIAHTMKFDKEPDYQPARTGEQLRSVIDNTLALQELGWKPQYHLYDGLIETVQYFKERTVISSLK